MLFDQLNMNQRKVKTKSVSLKFHRILLFIKKKSLQLYYFILLIINIISSS